MSLIKITDQALERMKTLLASRETPTKGLRFGTSEQGCSGLKYVVDFVDEINPEDEKVKIDGVDLFISRESLMFLIGSTVDYEEGDFSSGFVFINPNEKSRCGCGESFNV